MGSGAVACGHGCDPRVHHFGADTFCLFSYAPDQSQCFKRYIRTAEDGRQSLHTADGALLASGGRYNWTHLLDK